MDFKFDLDLGAIESFMDSAIKEQEAYKDSIDTERLVLKKVPTPDFVSTVYAILLKETQDKIGEVTLIYDGEIWYKVEKAFRRKGYATEAVSKLIEISTRKYFFLSIDFSNIASKKVAKKLGFKSPKLGEKIWELTKN